MEVKRVSVTMELIRAALRNHHDESSQMDVASLKAVDFGRLSGGKNNGVYRANVDGGGCCIKIYKMDERQRGKREWTSLLYLRAHGIDYAPYPYHFEVVNETAIVVMALVGGQNLGHRCLSQEQLDQLVCGIKGLNMLPFANGTQDNRMVLASERVNRLISSMSDIPVQNEIAVKLLALWNSWLHGPDPDLLRQSSHLVFSRMDTSLANLMWDGDTIRFVDFEYGGWTELVFDLAEQVEHIQSRGTPDTKWDWFLNQFDLQLEEKKRLKPAQRLLVFDWTRRFWPAKDQPVSDRFAAQVQRASRLCQA